MALQNPSGDLRKSLGATLVAQQTNITHQLIDLVVSHYNSFFSFVIKIANNNRRNNVIMQMFNAFCCAPSISYKNSVIRITKLCKYIDTNTKQRIY